MKSVKFILITSLLGILCSCGEIEFLPTKGSVYGIVVDNNNMPLGGVEVVASFTAPESSSGFLTSPVSNATSGDGKYQVDEVWDEVHLEINHTGFLPAFQRVELVNSKRNAQVNFTLIGSPTIQSVTFSQDTLNKDSLESLIISMVGEDLFNTFPDTPVGTFLVQNSEGQTVQIQDAEIDSQSQTSFLFRSLLTSDDLPRGTYQVIGEVIDTDGNRHALSSDESFEIL